MDNDELDDSFLTVAEVAELLKLNKQTVRNWIDRGSLPALKVGRRVRIRRSDLARVLGDSPRSAHASPRRHAGPDADAFWSGEHVGEAELPDGSPAASA